MSIDPGAATRECPACHSAAPEAPFCGRCGASLAGPVTAWSTLLRPQVYATAHREPLWAPRVTSTLFPRVAGATRMPYRVGLVLILIAICVLSAMRLNVPLLVISVIGLPLLFLVYLWESDVFTDIPRRTLATSMLLGIALGAGAWLIAGRLVARSYGLSTGSGLLFLVEELHAGFLLAAAGVVLMVVPALVTRIFSMPQREALDGFVVGAFGALCYSTAAVITMLVPQLTEGLVVHPDAGKLFENSITAIVNAVVTIALGGVVGLALWFRPHRRAGRDPRRARLALAACVALAAGCYVAVWADFPVSQFLNEVAELALAVVALIVVRSAVQLALLHEEPDPATGDPVLCVHCERVVPDLPFCVACGAAARASSRSSRRLRHQSPPVRVFVGG